MSFLGSTCAALLLTAAVASPAMADADVLFREKSKPIVSKPATVQEQVFQAAWTRLSPAVEEHRNAFKAQLVLATSEAVSVLEINERDLTVGEFLKGQGVNIRDYHTEAGTPIKPKTKFKQGKTLFLFKLEYSSTFETITLAPPVERVESASMPVGTEVVLEEGTEGTALKTIVAKHDLSEVRKLNRKARRNSPAKPVLVETLTVVTAPTPRTVLVGTATEEMLATSTEVSEANLIFPVDAPVTSPFGMRVHPITHIYKLHDGTDFGAPCGTEVHAVTGGTVTLVDELTGYGNQVEIDHGGGFVTSYSHLEAFAVAEGDVVKPGQTVGLVGSTGWSTGCHLHFMTVIDGEPVDPMEVLDGE